MTALAGVLLIAAGLALLRVELSIHTTGQVYARDEARLYAPMAGIVKRLYVELGQAVRAGELLVEMDDTELALRDVQLQRQLAEIEAALAQQDIARRELDVRPASLDILTAQERRKRLARIAEIQQQIESSYNSGHDQQIISELELRRQEILKLRSEMELIEAAILADWERAGLPALEAERIAIEQRRLETQRELIRRELDWVQRQRASLELRAPTDGVVVALSARFPGMAVDRGSELIKLAPTNGPLWVTALVPERNIDLLREGTPAVMESRVFDSMLEGPVRGRVQRVAPEATVAQAPAPAASSLPRYEVDIAVEESPYPLVLGSRLDIRLLLGRRSVADVLFRSARNLRAHVKGSL